LPKSVILIETYPVYSLQSFLNDCNEKTRLRQQEFFFLKLLLAMSVYITLDGDIRPVVCKHRMVIVISIGGRRFKEPPLLHSVLMEAIPRAVAHAYPAIGNT
jgi:hypothetical protein